MEAHHTALIYFTLSHTFLELKDASYFVYCLRFYLFWGGGKENKRERNTEVREKHRSAASDAP